MTHVDSADWGPRYRELRRWYQRLADRTEKLLSELLTEAQLDVAQIQARTKSVESFVRKVGKMGARLDNPFTQVTDLVGLRIIIWYVDDIKKVAEIIENEFEIAGEPLDTTRISLDDPPYTILHYNVKPSRTRCHLSDWRPYEDVNVEIQLRTVIEHTWMTLYEKESSSNYKDDPKEIQIRLTRLNALIELADDQFAQLRTVRRQVQTSYINSFKTGNLDIPLDQISLAAYIAHSDHRKTIASQMQRSHAVTSSETDVGIRNKRNLLNLLNHIGIQSIAQLDNYLSTSIIPTSIPDDFLQDEDLTLEDLLTLIIMADQHVDDTIYNLIRGDGRWHQFEVTMRAWDSQKRHDRNIR